MSSTRTSSFEIETAKRSSVPPKASWTRAIPSPTGTDSDAATPRLHLPQTIAHRGFKARCPENSMAGFQEAVRVGAHALETDLRLSADGIIVLSHDPSLKRCFGVDRLVSECEWEYLSGLRTVRKPGQAMARLDELLEWLVSSRERDGIWLMLDIKISSDADALMKALKSTLHHIPSPIPWDKRIVLGCWNATYIQSALSFLPSFSLCHISMSVSYSRHFSPIPNLSFSLSKFSLLGPWGTRFLRDAKNNGGGGGVPTFTWTVNQERWMEWFIRKNSSSSDDKGEPASAALIDGVITDDPQLFLDICAKIQAEMQGDPIPAIAYENTQRRHRHDNSTNKESYIKAWLNGFLGGISSLCQLLWGSYFRTRSFLVMRYWGYFDTFSDADFLAQFSAVDDVEDD